MTSLLVRVRNILMAMALVIAGVALLGSPAGATGNTDPESCTPSDGTPDSYTEWTKTGYTSIQHGGVPTPPGPDTDLKKYVGPSTWIHTLAEAYDETITDKAAWTETIEGTDGFWTNFQPNDNKGTFAGPPLYPTDGRGSWSDPKVDGGPDKDAEGVYQNGSGNGSWFYRAQGTDEKVIEHPAETHIVRHDAVTETDSKYKIYERTLTPGTDPVVCPPPTEENNKKIVVCKYVGTPPGVLDHVVIVSENTLNNVEDADGNPYVPGQFPFSWTDAQGQTQEGSVAIRYAKDGEQMKDVSLTECSSEEEPEVCEPEDYNGDQDGCGTPPGGEFPYEVDVCWTMVTSDGVENTYQFPQTRGCDTVPVCEELVEFQYDTYWIRDLDDQEYLAGLQRLNSPADDARLEPHNYSSKVVKGDEECPKTEIELPEPSVTDPCGVGNAAWDVPTDTEVFDWELVDGELIVTILTKDTVFEENGESSYNFGVVEETNTQACVIKVNIPAQPGVTDPCGAGNAAWNVPDDANGLVWTVNDAGELIVTITTANTEFNNSNNGPTSHNFGTPTETVVEPCEVAGVQLEIPAEPAVRDPCGAGNAKWVVPAATNKLDWTLTDGVLSVEITAPDTVFDGTQETTFSFGRAEETNKKACEVKGEEGDPPVTVEVKGAQAVAPAAVPTSVDAGLGVEPVVPIPAGRNSLWLLAVGSGLALMGSAGWRRRTADR